MMPNIYDSPGSTILESKSPFLSSSTEKPTLNTLMTLKLSWTVDKFAGPEQLLESTFFQKPGRWVPRSERMEGGEVLVEGTLSVS